MTLTPPVTIVFADDQAASREAMELCCTNLPFTQLCAVAQHGKELLRLVNRFEPSIVITDIQMPVLNGIEACEIIKELHPATKVLAFTAFGEETLIARMMQAGADGYIIKTSNNKTIQQAIETVLQGQPYFCSGTNIQLVKMLVSGALGTHVTKPLKADFFNAHEKNILMLICEQLNSKQIAQRLQLAKTSVDKYRQNLMIKTQTHNTAGLIAFAIQHGIYRFGQQ